MNEIPWERTADGVIVQYKHNRIRIDKGGFALKRIAIAKMAEVSLISAEFDGDVLVFELRMGVYRETKGNAEFFGVYQSGFPTDEANEKPQTLPTFCIRRAYWNRAKDAKQFHQAVDKKAYLEGSGQIDAQLAFVTSEMYPLY